LIATVLLIASSLMGQGVVTMPPQTAFSDMRLGLFVHYTYVGRPYKWGCTTWSDGSPVASLDELADNLDVQDLVRTAAAMGAQYLQFTKLSYREKSANRQQRRFQLPRAESFDAPNRRQS